MNKCGSLTFAVHLYLLGRLPVNLSRILKLEREARASKDNTRTLKTKHWHISTSRSGAAGYIAVI